MKSVPNKSVGLDFVRNSANSYAFISTRDHLINSMHRFGPNSFYLPPLTEDSSLFVHILAIAVRKEFKFKKEFNILYAFLFRFYFQKFFGFLNKMYF